MKQVNEQHYVTNIDYTGIEMFYNYRNSTMECSIINYLTNHKFLLLTRKTPPASSRDKMDSILRNSLISFFSLDSQDFKDVYLTNDYYNDIKRIYDELMIVRNKLGTIIWKKGAR